MQGQSLFADKFSSNERRRCCMLCRKLSILVFCKLAHLLVSSVFLSKDILPSFVFHHYHYHHHRHRYSRHHHHHVSIIIIILCQTTLFLVFVFQGSVAREAVLPNIGVENKSAVEK